MTNDEKHQFEKLINALDRHTERLWRMGARQDHRSIDSADKAHDLICETIEQIRHLLERPNP